MRIWILALCAAFVALAAGVAQAEDFRFATPPAAIAMRAPDGATQPIALTRVVATIPAGTQWAEFASSSAPFPCVRDKVLSWREADNEPGTDTFARVVRNELAAAGFATAGGAANLFERDGATTDLQLGAVITRLRVRTCYMLALRVAELWDTRSLMDVEWQVYSVSQGKVVARITTSGGFVTKTADASLTGAMSGAFADNVRRLTQSTEFRRAVTSNPASDLADRAIPSALEVIRFTPARPAKAPLSTAVQSVVSIFAGEGLGSGVLISTDGYILTNHHVAGAKGKVRIRWSDGVETVGDVIRGDARRDVALIKTTPRARPLSLRGAPALLGETVFAIGTPLDKDLAGTLTRGIVSANRQIEGLSWIQSDVAVTHGNSGGPLLDETGAVVGLTDWGVAPNGVSANINFFVPIDDALKVLALAPAGPAS